MAARSGKTRQDELDGRYIDGVRVVRSRHQYVVTLEDQRPHPYFVEAEHRNRQRHRWEGGGQLPED
jgi:hypothetical protein